MTQEQHLLEYLHHLLNRDPVSGLRIWTHAFDRALRGWNAKQCHLLLTEMRRTKEGRSPRGRAMAIGSCAGAMAAG